jgi:hypothetical protein
MNVTEAQKTIAEAQTRQAKFFLFVGVLSVTLLLMLTLFWGPVMRPWTQERLGTANLRKAEFDNQIQAEQSAAESDAAKLRAQAIAIVGAVAKQYPEYRSQEFIGGFADALRAGEVKQTFYIPTQSSIPVLPAMAAPMVAPASPAPAPAE